MHFRRLLGTGLACASVAIPALAQAPFPFQEGFESGVLSNYWTATSTPNGRIRIITTNQPFEGLRHVVMDVTNSGTYARNELVLTVDLSGATSVIFSCVARDFSDEMDLMPTSFVGSVNADGIAISSDGSTWHRLAQLVPNNGLSYTNITVNLSAFAAARGLTLGASTKIKFQQYDNFPIPTDGWSFDRIRLLDGSATADLELQLLESSDPSPLPSNLVYSVSVSNRGPSASVDVVLTNTLPVGPALVSVTGTRGSWVTNAGRVVASAGTLGSGETALYTIRLQPSVVGRVTNSATVSSSTPDPDPLNNARVETTFVDLEGGVLQFATNALLVQEDAGWIGITVVRTGRTAGAVSAQYAAEDGTAIGGTDYGPATGTVSFANGETLATIWIQVLNDSNDEPHQAFSVRLFDPAGGATLGARTNLAITLRDDDGVATFPFKDGLESPLLSNCWRTASLWNGRIQVTTNFGPRSGSQHVVMDSDAFAYGLSELTLAVDLAGQPGVRLRFGHKRYGTEWDDPMQESFFYRDYADGVAVGVDGVQWFRLTGLTAAESGTNAYTLFDIPIGPTLVANGLSPTNVVFIRFQQFDYQSATNGGRAFDDIELYSRAGAFRFAVSNVAVAEGAGTVTLRVERVEGDSGAVRVDYATSNATAMAGADYVTATGTLVFADGETARDLEIAILQDPDDEPVEFFTAHLFHPMGGAVLEDPSVATVRIEDDDGPGEITFTSAAFVESEENGFATILVDRLYGTQGVVTVDFATPPGGTATPGSDYDPVFTTLTFPPGVTRQVVEVPLLDDFDREDIETVLLVLSNATGGAVLGAIPQATLSILDNDIPRATFPFYEGFESALTNAWTLRTTGVGRISTAVTTSVVEGLRCLSLDATTGSALNEATLAINLADQTNVIFRCWTRDFGDAPHPMPAQFTGSTNADGIAVSADGLIWHRLVDLAAYSGVPVYTGIVVDLAAFAASRGIPLTPAFQIRFQQYDNGAIPARGRLFDHISIAPRPAITSGVVRFQGFEGDAQDSWDFHIVPAAGRIQIQTNRAYSGRKSLQMINAASVINIQHVVFENVSLAGLTKPYISVAYSANGPDQNDDLYLDLSYDNGATWNGTGSVKLVDGFSNANIPFGGTSATNPTTTATNPYRFDIPAGRDQVRVRFSFQMDAANSTALDSYFVDHIELGYSLTNQPPTLDPIGDRFAMVSNRLIFAVVARDVDHDPITLTAAPLPPGASFDPVTAQGPITNHFEFTPTLDQDGTAFPVTFTAADKDGERTETILIRVRDKVIQFAPASVRATEGDAPLPVQVSISRATDATIQFVSSGTAEMGPSADFFLSSTALVFVAGGSATQTVLLHIRDDALAEGTETALVSAVGGQASETLALTLRDNDSISIASANLTSGGSRSYVGEGRRILQALDADVVAIQEFNVAGGPRAFVDEVFGTNFHYFVEPSGAIPNGVISRWPILDAGEWDDPMLTDRDFVWARIDVPNHPPLTVISVHLYYSGGAAAREQQARTLTNLLFQAGLHTSDFVVLCGDFNTQNRSEAALQVLTTMLRDDRQPADQYGDTDTNQNRDKPYDFVLATPRMNDRTRPIRFGGLWFTNGVVFDTRLWTNGIPPPALLPDSGVGGMQHMAVMKLFALDSLFTLSTWAVGPGSITPTNALVAPGSNQAFTITADAYHHVAQLATNGSPLSWTGAPASMVFVWSNVQDSGILQAVFDEDRAIREVPHWWLAAHGMTNGGWDAGALSDTDGDGAPAWEEFVADTDPNDSASRFEIRMFRDAGGRLIEFVSSTSRTYTLDFTPDASSGDAWTPIAAIARGSNLTTTVAATNEPPAGLYRIRAHRP